jgi:hypothetical protein
MRKRNARAALVAAVALAGIFAATGSAEAYNFPFNGRCGQSWIFDGPSQTTATYDHKDGNLLYYKITWGGQPPVPGDPLNQANWASCVM